MRGRLGVGVVLLCLCALGTLVSSSASASGAGDSSPGDPAQIAALGTESCAGGVLFETLAGAVNGCMSVPPAFIGRAWSVSAHGSLVSTGQGEGPVTLVRPQPDGQAVVLDSNPHDFDASLSPDGSKVVFARAVPQTYQGAWPSDIFVVNTDGSGLKQVASGNGSELVAPTFSPDGSSIAYSCMPSGQSGAKNGSVGCGPLPDGTHRAAATVLMTADGSDKRVILLDPTAHFLSWSADGKWIATESVGPCTCSDGSTRNTNIFAYHTDGSDLFNDGDPSRQVTHEKDSRGADFGQFLMASSGELVYYRPVDDSGGAAGYDYTILVDGTHRRELPLSDQGLHYGVAIPDATGAGPPPFVNVTRVRVPAVRALSYRAARHRLQAAHLRVGIIHRRYSSRTPRNHVLRQYPRGGTYAHRSNVRGPRVNLTLSRGARK